MRPSYFSRRRPTLLADNQEQPRGPFNELIQEIDLGEDPFERLAVSEPGAAEMLGVSRATIYSLLQSDEIKSFAVGRRRLIPVHALRGMVGAPAEAQVDTAPESIRDAGRDWKSPLPAEETFIVTIRRA